MSWVHGPTVVPRDAALLFQKREQSSRKSSVGGTSREGRAELGVLLSGHICSWSC